MYKLFQNWYRRHFSEPGTVEFGLVLFVVFIMVYYFMWLVGPIVIALCIAYCLDGAVEKIQHKMHMGRTLATSLVMTAFISVCVLFALLVVPLIIDQGVQFYTTIVAMSQDAVSTMHHKDDVETITVNDIDMLIVANLYDIFDNMPDSVTAMLNEQTLLNTVKKIRVQLLEIWAGIMRTQLVPSVVNAFTWIVYLIIVPIFSFLMLLNKKDLQTRMATYVLPNNQVLMKRLWPSINEQISGYIRGKVLHIVVISIVNTIALMCFDLNYAIFLGIGVGLSVVIPYVGAVLIAVPVLFVAIFQFGFSSTLLYLLLVYTIIQLLDSNVLTPMLFSKALNLDAFSILAAILIFGQLWGFWGVFLAIPLATLVKTLIVNWPSLDKSSQSS